MTIELLKTLLANPLDLANVKSVTATAPTD